MAAAPSSTYTDVASLANVRSIIPTAAALVTPMAIVPEVSSSRLPPRADASWEGKVGG